MQHFGTSILLGLGGLICLPSFAAATIQDSDRIKYDRMVTIVLEAPLQNVLWKNGSLLLDFDEETTSNRKGYTAEWEIRDSKLFLVSFKARIKGRRVSIRRLIPGAKLPLYATWFNGTLYIPTGEELNGPTFANWTKYERLDVLEVRKGTVVGRQVKHNTSAQDLIEAQAAKTKTASSP